MTGFPKPARGTAAKEKTARRARVVAGERAAKVASRVRDRYRCRRCGWGRNHGYVESAHIVDKGMGGDHGRRSSRARDYVTLCVECHRGRRSVHSGHVEIVAGPDGGDGVVEFITKETL